MLKKSLEPARVPVQCKWCKKWYLKPCTEDKFTSCQNWLHTAEALTKAPKGAKPAKKGKGK